MRNKNEKFENTPEILLVSSNEYDKLINDPHKLDVLKFLVRLMIIFTYIENLLSIYLSVNLPNKNEMYLFSE